MLTFYFYEDPKDGYFWLPFIIEASSDDVIEYLGDDFTPYNSSDSDSDGIVRFNYEVEEDGSVLLEFILAKNMQGT